MSSLKTVLAKMKNDAYSLRDMGSRFEQIIKSYLLSDPKYSGVVETVWMWEDFPFRQSLGSLTDTGIDLVVKTYEDEFWAVQCKFYEYNRQIGKQDIDSFLSTSSKNFIDETENTRQFSLRLLVTTSSVWGSIAEQTIIGQNPPVIRVSLHDLEESGVHWEKIYEGEIGEEVRVPKYTLRPHQQEAFDKATLHFNSNDRGKMIMACGTGKTFTALRIAEAMSEKNGIVLFMVPSIALLGQTLNEWTKNASKLISPILICSDPKVNKDSSKVGSDDLFTSTVDLALPSSTNVEVIKKRIIREKLSNKDGMVVLFSTYQSIDVVSEVQSSLINDSSEFIFDLTICDEAHRTTGVTLEGKDESHFVKVHDDKFIKSRKRLYMTATPRLYTEDSKAKAEESNAILCSMDDENIYGEEFHRIGFGEAVERDLLSDYKVLVLTVNESDIPTTIQKMLTNEYAEIESDDLSKIVGSINALSKKILGDEGVLEFVDPAPMMRSVAFTNTIYNSKQITDLFNSASRSYFELLNEEDESVVEVSSKHIDGSMSALERNRLMSWLKEEDKENQNESRILTNVRCLSEGVDVPSLDAILFLSARSSQVDVVQSVGRVMRKSPGKKYGYIIIPIVVPYDVDANTALDNNQRFKVVWSVLNALRAHDDRFNAQVNKIDLNKKKPDNILIGQISRLSDEDQRLDEIERGVQQTLDFDEFKQAMYAKIVKKVGDRNYWEQWASSVGEIAKTIKSEINLLIDSKQQNLVEFDKFIAELRTNINPSISKQESIEMLAQHIITKPIFEALFDNYSFVNSNAISIAIQKLLKSLHLENIESKTFSLNGFYESVKRRADGIDNHEGRQKVVVELYDKFFKTAFPKMVEQLGIVYTPIEIVDFILNSINVLLKDEFNLSLSNEATEILDPFTGTGTFITRLLQLGLIEDQFLLDKYNNQIFANEIVLLAYYIAAINIENALHEKLEMEEFVPFEGIVLTDTFQLNEALYDVNMSNEVFPTNSERVEKQRRSNIKVIIGNPPYSVGQKKTNDDNENQNYPRLNQRIKETYAANSKSSNLNSLYDSYIKAFRWSSDRLGKSGGVIGFITNGFWLEGISTDGFRASLVNEFNKIYVINLKGNARTSGEVWKKEGGKIFGQGSRTPVAITLLVKHPVHSPCEVHYYDIGDYLSRTEKLDKIKDLISISSLSSHWTKISPDENNNWLKLHDINYKKFYPLYPSKKFDLSSRSYFVVNSLGIATSRDSWAYNSSKSKVNTNMESMITYYNEMLDEYWNSNNDPGSVKDFIDMDESKISWSSSTLARFERKEKIVFDSKYVVTSNYRPFFKQFLYFDDQSTHRKGQNREIFEIEKNNEVIFVSGVGSINSFSALMINIYPDTQFLPNGQAFPKYLRLNNDKEKNLFSEEENIISGISDFIFNEFSKKLNKKVDKDDIFYYVYAVLNSDQYKKKYSSELKSELPRIPLVDSEDLFTKIVNIGKELGRLHVNYEEYSEKANDLLEIVILNETYSVRKMNLIKTDQDITLVFNDYITIRKIPIRVLDFKLGNKSPLEWLVDRYAFSINKKTGIENNPNDYCLSINDEKYIFNLAKSLIYVSLTSIDLINQMPSITD